MMTRLERHLQGGSDYPLKSWCRFHDGNPPTTSGKLACLKSLNEKYQWQSQLSRRGWYSKKLNCD